MKIVLALGGNAFNKPSEPITQEVHMRNIEKAAEVVTEIVRDGHHVVITHGNGPQVGFLAELQRGREAFKLDALTAATQGLLGYFIAAAVDKRLGSGRTVVVVTRVEVDCDDAEFGNPTKFVGPLYTEEAVHMLSAKYGWKFRQDSRGGWRRVVPSPKPRKIVEIDVVKRLLADGYVVVAAGGGGISMCGGAGVEGIVDKDLTSALIAMEISADFFVILTDVDGVYLNYGKPGQKKLERVKVDELERYYAEGHFPPGSMGPKIQAVTQYVYATGGRAAVGSLDEGSSVYRGEAGTQIFP